MSKLLQKQFINFHDKIKLNDLEHHKELRDKRDLLLSELRAYIDKKYEDKPDEKKPTFNWFNQGSYDMGTGIIPIDGDYDIDVAVEFNFAKEDFGPVEIKELIHEALDKHHKRKVDVMRPCVRVQYYQAGETIYHVDFAVYSGGSYNKTGKTYIAKGKIGSKDEYKIWEVSDPKKLKELVNNRFPDTDECSQFKRIIRYMKRWKDQNFSSTGHAAPRGIALTALAYNLFVPDASKDSFTGEKRADDLEALLRFVKAILNQFSSWDGNISVKLPVEPYNDLFAKMAESDDYIEDFKSKLKSLRDKLESAKSNADPVEACKDLQKVFGEDFPVPPKEETAQKRPPAITKPQEQA